MYNVWNIESMTQNSGDKILDRETFEKLRLLIFLSHKELQTVQECEKFLSLLGDHLVKIEGSEGTKLLQLLNFYFVAVPASLSEIEDRLKEAKEVLEALWFVYKL